MLIHLESLADPRNRPLPATEPQSPLVFIAAPDGRSGRARITPLVCHSMDQEWIRSDATPCHGGSCAFIVIASGGRASQTRPVQAAPGGDVRRHRRERERQGPFSTSNPRKDDTVDETQVHFQPRQIVGDSRLDVHVVVVTPLIQPLRGTGSRRVTIARNSLEPFQEEVQQVNQGSAVGALGGVRRRISL